MKNPLKIAVILGTRPEVIKLAPVILEARKRGHHVTTILSGQHAQMALPLLGFFGIEPDLNLDVMQPNQTLSSLSSRVISALDSNRDRIAADVVIVQGDTTTAFCGAYWAFCQRIPVAHVEAGLRTYDLSAPFPEEANRQLIGRIARFHFAPTQSSARALKAEKIPPSLIHTVGNTAIDALHFALKRVEKPETIPPEQRLDPKILEFIGDRRLVLVTAHRRENFGRDFEAICAGIRGVADAHPDTVVVYPVHPNPNVRAPVERLLSGHERILLCDPQPYAGFVSLMKRSDLLLTDSGGIQEEGPTLRKPILVMRRSTERPEGVKAGFAKLVGCDTRKIIAESKKALKQGCRARGKNPYGDGRASGRVIAALKLAHPPVHG